MIGILTRKLLRKSGLSSRGAHPKYVRPRTLLRLAVSETALLGGGQHPLHQEIAALAHAVASPENAAKILVAREALLAKSNEHVLLDTAGIIGFFATITVVVDFTGHYSDDILKKTEMMVQS
ncbi:unnamed protein product [Symbiodinium microadriaticum]|nr:unnamed protein product [Symbiodinium microadriaticum]